jgi:hypothetical protein
MNTIANGMTIPEIAQPDSIEPRSDNGTRLGIFNAV